MANFVMTSNPQVVAPGDQANNAFIIPNGFIKSPKAEGLIQIKVTAGSFVINGEGPVTADSPEFVSGETYPSFQAGSKFNSAGKIAFHFVDQDGSGEMIVSVL